MERTPSPGPREIAAVSFAKPNRGLPKICGMVGGMKVDITPALAEKVAAALPPGITHDEIRESGGPSSPTMTKVLSGDGAISEQSARKLENLLGWSRGSVRAAAAGGEPRYVVNDPSTTAGAHAHVVQTLAESQRSSLTDFSRVIESVISLLALAAGVEEPATQELLLLAAQTALTHSIETRRDAAIYERRRLTDEDHQRLQEFASQQIQAVNPGDVPISSLVIAGLGASGKAKIETTGRYVGVRDFGTWSEEHERAAREGHPAPSPSIGDQERAGEGDQSEGPEGGA